MTYPPDSILLPYDDAHDPASYEHGLAEYAHQNRGLAETSEYKRDPSGAVILTFCALTVPIIAWNLDTGRTGLCRCWILIENNASGRLDVWLSDDVQFCHKLFLETELSP